jgi:hypothetical protein
VRERARGAPATKARHASTVVGASTRMRGQLSIAQSGGNSLARTSLVQLGHTRERGAGASKYGRRPSCFKIYLSRAATGHRDFPASVRANQAGISGLYRRTSGRISISVWDFDALLAASKLSNVRTRFRENRI